MDLRLLHEYRVPIFSLAEAVAAPKIYEGRYVLFRAKLTEVRGDGADLAGELEEYALQSEERKIGVLKHVELR